MKKKRNLKSYKVGTSKNGVVKIYNETPAEAMAENEIAKAKAKYESETDFLGNALGMIGNMGMSIGGSMMSKGISEGDGADGKGLDGFLANNQGMFDILQFAGNASQFMENGGEVGSIPVEVEGGEVAELPDGQMTEFKGPSHNQGGIEVALPEGTTIFSKKLKVKGKSLADRKKTRENKMKTLEKKLKDNPTDKILKETIERTSQVHQQEELADFQLQEFANILDGLQTFAYGTAKHGLKKMNNGGKVRPYFSKGYDNTMFNDYLQSYMQGNPDFNIEDEEQRKSLQSSLGVGSDGIFGPKTLSALKSQYPIKPVSNISTNDNIDKKAVASAMDSLKGKDMDASLYGATEAIPAIDGLEIPELEPISMRTPGIVPDSESGSASSERSNGDLGFTFGDMTGMLGTAISTIGPYLQTLKNRAEDTPNINAFENFGEDALETNEEAQGFAASQRDNAMNRILSNRNATVTRNRNTARGVNTMRALDLTADQNVNRAMADVYDNFSRQMISMLGQKSQLENQQDAAVMEGEQRRDLADRMDKDNFRTQLAQDMSNIGAGVQKLGADFNKNKENNDFLDILPDLSQYGLGYVYDSNGNLVIEKVQ